MTENLVQIASPADARSCFVPAYGFPTAEQARAYADGRSSEDNGGPRYAPAFLTRKFNYVPLGTSYDRCGDTDELMSAPRMIGGKPAWQTVRKASEPKPEGSYNVALLVEGPRQFHRFYRHTVKRPPFWWRMNTGNRDCYMLWLPTRGDALYGPDRPEPRVFAARSARGVLYAEEQQFNDKGEPHEVLTTIVGKEFSIMDRDTNRDVCIRFTASFRLARSGTTGADLSTGWLLEGLEDWRDLIETAQRRFRKYCRPLPEDVERWQKWFVEQRAKAIADSNIFDGSSFADSIKGLDWQEALRRVEQAWQLQAVIRHHCDGKFDDTPRYMESTSRRWSKMLAQHDCCPTRREQLHRMVVDFVGLSDRIWNYCGD